MGKKKEDFVYVFRVESKHDHHGAFTTRDFCKAKEKWLGLACYENIFGDYHNNRTFPDLDEDFKQKDLPEDWENIRTGVHIPCLLLFWFGPFMHEVLKKCHIYKVKVKAIKIGKSKKQCIYWVHDEISRRIIKPFENHEKD